MIEMEPRIRCSVKVMSACEDDYPFLKLVEKDGYQKVWPLDAYKKLVQSNRGFSFYKAVDNSDEIVGMMAVVSTKSSYKIVKMAVREKNRREGVGTAMMNRIKDRAYPQSKSIKSIVTWSNGMAQKFLLSCGFEYIQDQVVRESATRKIVLCYYMYQSKM